MLGHSPCCRILTRSPTSTRRSGSIPSWPCNDRGVAYRDKGDLDRAIAEFNEAIRPDPKSAYAYRNRGGAYVVKGDLDPAIADIREAVGLDQSRKL
jgi:tetratricopeptide (TPR) repeat protein